MKSATLELARRTNWAIARIGEVVNLGRSAGWLPGQPMGSIDSSAFEASEAGTPMSLLASRLDLTSLEMDALWLLACVELDPHVANVVQLLASPGMSDLSAQML